MSRDDEDKERTGERPIAIPGYRPSSSDATRHRPPSVQRSERVRPPNVGRAADGRSDPPARAASDPPGDARGARPGGAVSGAHAAVGQRVSRPGAAVSGAHAAVRPGAAVSGAHAAVRPGGAVSGAHAAVRPGAAVSGAHAAVRPGAGGSGASAAARPGSGGSEVSAARPGGAVSGAHAAVRPGAGRTLSGSFAAGVGETADADPVAAPRGGARGVEALQAEVARDDIRVLARQLVEAETRSSGASLARPVARTPGAWLRWRPYLAGVILVGAALFAGWPVYAIHAEQQAQARLAEAVQAAARGVSQGTEPGQIAGWIRERDLRALRDLYGTQRPRAAEALRAAGFDAVRAEDVSIRVDYDNATLVLTAQVPQDELHALTASANLAGEPVGRAAPVPALGPIVADRGAAIGALLLSALALAGAMWAVPALMARRRG